MKSSLILSVTLFCLGTLAFSANAYEMTNESGTDEFSTSYVQSGNGDALDAFFQEQHILDSGKNVRYMKNPCAGIKGYRFQSVRGFGFENGIVKEFGMNGQLTTENAKYKSLGDFLRSRKLCQAQHKKMPSLHVNIYLSEIW